MIVVEKYLFKILFIAVAMGVILQLSVPTDAPRPTSSISFCCWKYFLKRVSPPPTLFQLL